MKRKREVLGEPVAYVSFDTRRTASQTTRATILHCRGNVFKELLPSSDKGTYTQVQQFFYCCMCPLPRERVYRALPKNDLRDTHTHTQTDGRNL
jgi:hypothetical protein